jgi:hypothetical protein
MAITTKANALIKSGWFPLAPSTLFYFCMEGHSMDSLEAFEGKWAKYACDPSNNVCCPATKVTPAPAQCSANGACQPRSGCQVVYDNCFNSATESYSINLMAGKVFATCPAGCDVIASTMQGGSYTPLPIMGADGNITTGICTNKTIVSKCSSATTADSCLLLIEGQQACEFETECKPPAASNFDCSNNPDTCCIASSTPVFTATEASACAAGNATISAAGLGCAVKKGCIQVVDPCASIVAPWGERRLPELLHTCCCPSCSCCSAVSIVCCVPVHLDSVHSAVPCYSTRWPCHSLTHPLLYPRRLPGQQWLRLQPCCCQHLPVRWHLQGKDQPLRRPAGGTVLSHRPPLRLCRALQVRPVHRQDRHLLQVL